MKFKLFIYLTPFLLLSCQKQIEYNDGSLIKEHSYTEVEDKIIEWSNVFNQNDNEYCVYFFSKTCHYCEEAKNEIIEIALTHQTPIYFCYDSLIQLDADLIVESTIGISSIDVLRIKGFPSIISFKNKVVFKHMVGKTDTLSFARNLL